MALSREKAKQPSKGIPVKATKPVSKVVKSAKKAAHVKVVAGTKAKPQKLQAVIAAKVPKAKSAAQQPQVTAPAVAKGKNVQLIEKAKAALKRESTVVEAAPPVVVKPLSKAKQRKIMIEASANEAASALAAKWASLFKKADQIDAKPYNMKAIFEEKTAIVHKVLGWGYILANRNDRLEVLFKDGIKHLISNYKP
ncbi:MAG: hypothetical protein ACXVA9_00140 [Bdellovibrionales bacterium]